MSATAPIKLDAEALRDPKERRAYRWLMGFAILGSLAAAAAVILTAGSILLFILPLIGIRYLAEWLANAYLQSNAIRISENQFSEIHAWAVQFAKQLDMDCPVIYVMQETAWNALALKLVNDRVVVLLSGAVDSILQKGNITQLAWLVGHEMGHHHAGHLSFWHRFAKTFGVWSVWIQLWYSRRCEFTADRYGLACARSLSAALGALSNLAVGAQLARIEHSLGTQAMGGTSRGVLGAIPDHLFDPSPFTPSPAGDGGVRLCPGHLELRVRAKITSGFGGSATGPGARSEGGSVSAGILDRPSDKADGPVPPRPRGLGPFGFLASLLTP
jgi:Zn-dependent protease with chaperone function